MRSMKRGVKRIKNYRFNRNTLKNRWKKEKQLRQSVNANMESSWDKTKTAKQNFEQAGLVYDLNKAVKINNKEKKTEVKVKEKKLEIKDKEKKTEVKEKEKKPEVKEKEKKSEVKETKMDTSGPVVDKNTPAKQNQVVKDEVTPPGSKTLRLSQPEVRYCIYMMEKYNEDYEAMAKDPKNENQETPAQIRKKILTFKSVPMQYNAYLRSKGTNGGSGDVMDIS